MKYGVWSPTKFFWALFKAVLIGWGPATPPPPALGYISVSQDRRHLFVTPWLKWMVFTSGIFEFRHWDENSHAWASLSSIVYLPASILPLLSSRVTGPVDIDRFNRGFAAAANQSTDSGSASANEKRAGSNSWRTKRSGAQYQERIVALVNRFRDKRHFATNIEASRKSNRQRVIVLQHLRMKQWPSGFLGRHIRGVEGEGNELQFWYSWNCS